MANLTLKMFQCLPRNAAAPIIAKLIRPGLVALWDRASFTKCLSTTSLVCSKHGHNSVERKYSDKHEWVSVKDDIGTVGISHYAQESLGEIVFAQLPQVGDSFEASAEVGALESVKAASELYAPVSGEIVEKNDQVEETPNLINSSCYDKGWLYKVKLDKPSELKKLMDEDDYQEYLKTQAHD